MTDTNIITDVSKNLNPNVTKHEDNNIQFQSMTKEQLLNVYMNQEFGMSADDITDMVTEDIKNILTDYDVSEDEFKFEDIRIYGSYSKGTNKVGSDLDIVVQYSGSLKEDSAFNMLHDEELSIYDKKGNKVKIDINPINTADHGSIDEYSKILFQSAYHGTPHRFDTFSTDNIGTGEGAQAHGWGLYYSQSKDVAEGYRKRLSDASGDERNTIIKRIKTYGKKAAKEFYKEKEKEFREEAKKTSDSEWWNKEADYFKDVYQNIIDSIPQEEINNSGQLFEVDIPDSDVLLDEDKLLGNMHLKEGLADKLLSWADDNGLYYNIDLSKTGGEIYDAISNKLGSDKKASELLNELGFKGITYDGRQDGRCYVIFDDKAVNVLKTYYQGENNNSKLTDEDKSNIQKFKDFVGKFFSNKLTKKDKSRPLMIGKTPSKLVDAGIPNNNLSIGYKVVEKAQDGRNDDHKLSQKTISKVLEALHTPIAIIKGEQNKNETKENNRYAIIVDLQNDKGNYVVVSIESDKNIGSGNVINDIRSIHSRQSFVPMLEKAINDNRLLKIKESKMKDLLLGNQPDIISGGGQVSLIDRIIEKNKSVNGGILFQDNEQGNSTEENIKGSRGFTYQRETAPNVIENIIVLLNNKADKSTLLHEFGHVYLQVMNDLARTNSKARERVLTIDKWLRHEQGSEYTTAQHEKFARGFVELVGT